MHHTDWNRYRKFNKNWTIWCANTIVFPLQVIPDIAIYSCIAQLSLRVLEATIFWRLESGLMHEHPDSWEVFFFSPPSSYAFSQLAPDSPGVTNLNDDYDAPSMRQASQPHLLPPSEHVPLCMQGSRTLEHIGTIVASLSYFKTRDNLIKS